jgi:regulator of CtrA degradation
MQHPAFVRKAYDETMTLMVEARNYLTYCDPTASDDTVWGLRRSCEAMRVTARLTNVMAWLMMQRAIEDGEIDEQDAFGDEAWLGDHETCLGIGDYGQMPAGLQSLLCRSRSLYRRISRIEAQMRSGPVEEAAIARESRKAESRP